MPYPINGPLHSNSRPSNIPPPGFYPDLPISKEQVQTSKFSSVPPSSANFSSNMNPTNVPRNDGWRTDTDTFSSARV